MLMLVEVVTGFHVVVTAEAYLEVFAHVEPYIWEGVLDELLWLLIILQPQRNITPNLPNLLIKPAVQPILLKLMRQLPYLLLMEQYMTTPRVNNRTGISYIRWNSMLFNLQAVVLDFKGFSGNDGHHIPVFDVMVDKVEVIAAEDEFC